MAYSGQGTVQPPRATKQPLSFPPPTPKKKKKNRSPVAVGEFRLLSLVPGGPLSIYSVAAHSPGSCRLWQPYLVSVGKEKHSDGGFQQEHQQQQHEELCEDRTGLREGPESSGPGLMDTACCQETWPGPAPRDPPSATPSPQNPSLSASPAAWAPPLHLHPSG
jgi:hypothetical protein